MAALFTNDSCNPFSETNASCTTGNYVSYTVNATGVDDYRKTLQFVQQHNIRLVIKNTGHEYNGKSAGAGSVGLWTHHLKEIQIENYKSTDYSGKAFKLGAGVQCLEAYEFAHANNLTIAGANEPTVGLAGGWSQGGGTGPLASLYGLGVDQVLHWEVMIASGDVIIASPDSPYADLFWALSGGGPGTYGVVLSVTVKAHPPMIMSVGSMTFSLSNGNSTESWQFLESFLEYTPSLTEAGTVPIWYIQDGTFILASLWGPNLTQTELDSLFQPMITELESLGHENTYSSSQYGSFLEGFQSIPAIAVANVLIGGRLIPRSLIDKDSKTLTSALRNISDTPGTIFSGVSLDVSKHNADSVGLNPYWRQSTFDAALGFSFNYTDWDSNFQKQDLITNRLLPWLEILTPDGGAYLNEADFQQADWEAVFYGSHYDRLKTIKTTYDPSGIFYGLRAVGSEDWIQKQDGRLCHL